MGVGKRKRLTLIALEVVGVPIVGGSVGFRVVLTVLKGRVVEALGPNTEIRDVRLGWSSVNMDGLRTKEGKFLVLPGRSCWHS